MKLSLSNGVFYSCTLEDNLSMIKKLGFENVEFNMKTVKREHEETVYLARQLLEFNGLNCLTLHSATHYVRDEIEIPKALYYLKVSAEFAHRLQAQTMVVHSCVSRKLPYERRCKILAKIFNEVVPYAKDLHINLALENLSYAAIGFGKNIDEIEQIMNAIEGETMGITIDFSHATATGVVFSLLEKYHHRLCNVHISNRTHKPFEKETPSLLLFIKKLREYEYCGPLTIEINRKFGTEDVLKTKLILERILNQKM